MGEIKSFIRGFNRTPIDSRDYMTLTNQYLLSAANHMEANGANPDTDIINIEWVPMNNSILLTVFYTNSGSSAVSA